MLLHASSHRTVDFTAKEDKALGTDSSLQHFIGVFDPATGQLQVVGAKKMEIRGNVRARDATEEQMKGMPLRKVCSCHVFPTSICFDKGKILTRWLFLQ